MRWTLAAVIVAALFGCATIHPHPTPPPEPITVSAAPAWAVMLADLVTAQIPDCATITWSVTEPGGGSVDPAGLYTAPACSGSTFTPGTYHVTATGCGHTATVAVNVAEGVTSVSVVCGVVGSASCCSPFPITIPPGSVVQNYASVSYTCPGHLVYSPATPPAMCTRSAAALTPPPAAKTTTRPTKAAVRRRLPAPDTK